MRLHSLSLNRSNHQVGPSNAPLWLNLCGLGFNKLNCCLRDDDVDDGQSKWKKLGLRQGLLGKYEIDWEHHTRRKVVFDRSGLWVLERSSEKLFSCGELTEDLLSIKISSRLTSMWRNKLMEIGRRTTSQIFNGLQIQLGLASWMSVARRSGWTIIVEGTAMGNVRS